MSANNRLRICYGLSDLLLSFAGIIIFDVIRYFSMPPTLESRPFEDWIFHDNNIIMGMILFPLMMIGLYAISGYYNDARSKGRIDDLRNTFAVSFIGMLLIYFIILINDYLPKRSHNYELLLALWLSLAIPVLIGRLAITAAQRAKLRAGHGAYRALIIASKKRAEQLKKRIEPKNRRSVSLFNIVGEISPDAPFEEIRSKIEEINPDAILLGPHPDGIQPTTELINRLYPFEKGILITPDVYQLITSRTRLTDIAGEPLIDITSARVSPSTSNLKRLADIAGSLFALITLSPVFLATALTVKLDSKGPIFYTQTRIGRHKKPFKIIKFRTMHPDAEASGPALSTEDDPRITRAGHFLRKYRLDELPQFWNVLRGDMSLVGPRPERKHYVDQIVERVPHYSLIHQVRPGITSWGMVKYGYASNVDEMVERLYYDLLYIENVSFAIDMKIIFHTVATVVSGRGL